MNSIIEKESVLLNLSIRALSLFSFSTLAEFKLSSSMNVVDLLVVSKLVSSKSEARRLIEQGGVRIADKKISGFEEKISPSKEGSIIQVGKRKFLRVVLK